MQKSLDLGRIPGIRAYLAPGLPDRAKRALSGVPRAPETRNLAKKARILAKKCRKVSKNGVFGYPKNENGSRNRQKGAMSLRTSAGQKCTTALKKWSIGGGPPEARILPPDQDFSVLAPKSGILAGIREFGQNMGILVGNDRIW